ncbi:hypothetical protein GF380_03880 [Candidatus Uhrbacteria bacterium]|nr:hypothetical protein [Candidatus Uhrbacteria bacterium]MBD3284233.1 hypothetical protein [Candidatus Uhrbacteria bacterium]
MSIVDRNDGSPYPITHSPHPNLPAILPAESMTRHNSITLFKWIAYLGIYGGLLMPLMFIPYVIFPFVFSKLAFFQVLISLTFPAYLALMWMEPKYRPPKSILYTAILAYFAAILLSVVFSVDPHRSWWGNQERMNGLFTMLHLLAWLTMAIGMLKTWVDWKRLLNYEISLSLFMAIVAILQKPFPRLLTFQAGERVGGLLDNPIYMGVYQIFNLSFLTLLFLKTKNTGLRVFYAIVAVVDLIAFFLTQSRGAFFGLAAVTGVFTLYYAIFTKSGRARIAILGAGAGFFALYILAYLFRASAFVSGNPILSRLTNLNATTETRLIAWEIAWKGFLERPLTGWGYDAFHILFNLKYNPKSLEFGYYETWFDRAHNTIMDVLAMTGIFGLITYLAIFVCIFYLVWKARKNGWIDLPIAAILTALPVGYFLQNLFVFDHPAAYSMSFLMFALIIAATRPSFNGEKDEQLEVQKRAETRSAPWMLFIIVQLALLLVAWRYTVLPFKASMKAIRANQLLQAGQVDVGFDLLKEAGEIPTPYIGEQAFLLSRDLIALQQSGGLQDYPRKVEMYAYAKEVNEEYVRRHPRNAHSLFVYARMVHGMFPILPEEMRVSEVMLTENLYLRAIEVSPERQQLHFGLARLYSQVGQSDKALEVLKRTRAFNENIGESWWYVGLVSWLEQGNEDEGTKALIEAQKVKAPFSLRNATDAMQLARAAAIQGDTEMLKDVMSVLADLNGSTEQYLQIAISMEMAGLFDERNIILNALLEKDPNLAVQLEPLASGEVATIEESLRRAADQLPELATTTPAQTDPDANTVSASTGTASSP